MKPYMLRVPELLTISIGSLESSCIYVDDLPDMGGGG